jgi:hypothetical protein
MHAARGLLDGGAIANIAAHEADAVVVEHLRHVVQRAARQVVEDDDLSRVVRAQQLLDRRRADQAAAAGDEDVGAIDFHAGQSIDALCANRTHDQGVDACRGPWD